jgi:hypothetical protein
VTAPRVRRRRAQPDLALETLDAHAAFFSSLGASLRRASTSTFPSA